MNHSHFPTERFNEAKNFLHTIPKASATPATQYVTILIMTHLHNNITSMPDKITVPETGKQIKLYYVYLLTNAESTQIYNKGRDGRKRIAESLARHGWLTMSSLSRFGVIDGDSKTFKKK